MTITPIDETRNDEEREWEEQESARLAQRDARTREGMLPASSYPKISVLLAQPDVPPLPGNLAHALAKRVEAIARARKRVDRAFLNRIRLVFALGYGSCMLLVSLIYRDVLISWLGSPAARILTDVAGWVLVLAMCVGVTWILAKRRHRS